MKRQLNPMIPFLIAIIASALFFILADYIFTSDLTNFQQSVFNFVSRLRNPHLNTFMLILTKTANPLPTIVLTLTLTLILLFKHQKKEALFSFLLILLTAGTNTLLKHLYLRQRPIVGSLIHETGFSFPSGHSMISLALALLLSYLSFHFLSRKLIAYLLSAFLLAYTFLIGFSRVYINVHYVGDVLGGWLASIVVFSILLCLFNLFSRTKRPLR